MCNLPILPFSTFATTAIVGRPGYVAVKIAKRQAELIADLKRTIFSKNA
jgi:hypothetical protein